MLHRCYKCGECYEDEWLLVAHHEIYHNEENTNGFLINRKEANRQSVIQYAPSTSRTREIEDEICKEELIAEALDGKVVRHFKVQNKKNLKFDAFIEKAHTTIKNILKNELERLNYIKFGLVLDTTFVNLQNEISPRGFITKNKYLMGSTNVSQLVNECFEEVWQKISDHQGRGSGWTLLHIIGVDVRVHKHGYGERGSSFIPLPKKLQNTHSCINVQNSDNECFKYSMLCKFVRDERNANRPNKQYKEVQHRYKFNCITYPVSLNDIKLFEKGNPGVSVNVFAIDDRNNVYPLKIVTTELQDHTDLLLLRNGNISHYVYIKNFNALVRNQLTRKQVGISVCKRCFCFTYKHLTRGGSAWLTEHQRLCLRNEPVKTIIPSQKNAFISFNKISHQYHIPIVIYADFESSLLPLDNCTTNNIAQIKYQQHKPNSFCILLKSDLSEEHLKLYGLTSKPLVYRGEFAAKKFVDYLYTIANRVELLYKYNVPMSPMSNEEILHQNKATNCYLCQCVFSKEVIKVCDHNHLTGKYRGAACRGCNINYKLPKFIPVVLHNLSGYDSHFIIPEIARDNGEISVLATSHEKFISFSKKINSLKLRFIDSYKFLPSSLSILTENLQKENLIETKKVVPAEKLNLVLRKGIFPYDYIDSLSRFDETALPAREKFYNTLLECETSQEDYDHAKKVWMEMGFKTLGQYSDFYVKLDVTLLCDIMEEFRKTCLAAYGLDPLHCYTSPGLAWQAMLKETKCKLQLLTDVDMILMVESGIRGGLTQCVTKYVKANNKHLPNYNSNEESIYLAYFDANNLYGLAMSMPLPYGNFKWKNPQDILDITSLSKHGNVGYILDCDFEYPENLHDHHYDLPLLPESLIPPEGKHKKLLTTLNNKERYVAHFWTVQQAIQLGLKVTKIHRVLEFSQSCWLKPYIVSNTNKRTASSSAFQKDFFKLMNNAIFGKTLENKRKHKNIKLVTDAKKLVKLVQKPNFKSSIIINENLVAVSMKKTNVKMDRPLYIGMSILDISKTHMYDFHFKKMVKYYGRNQIGISYMDTDSYIYWIKTKDMYNDLKHFPYANDFDLSDYPQHHPTYDNGVNKKVLGKFKDETKGTPITEMVGLMSKMYALKLLPEVTATCSKDIVIKKAKGIKLSYVKQTLHFEDYKKCLFENKTYTATFSNIRSFNHQLFSIRETKKSLTSSDDKRKTLSDGINTLPYGHYSFKMQK